MAGWHFLSLRATAVSEIGTDHAAKVQFSAENGNGTSFAIVDSWNVMDRSGIYRRPRVRSWWARTYEGEVRPVYSLAHMAQLLGEGHIDPRDEISVGDGVWTPLEDVLETRGLGETLARLGHLDAAARQKRSA